MVTKPSTSIKDIVRSYHKKSREFKKTPKFYPYEQANMSCMLSQVRIIYLEGYVYELGDFSM